ncbi:hypothetical protein VNI00_015901 [Paramarasmius palmivorus]|uniref:F-box domain-containing protein n=1 Tax=Paramarasmius palmivorus TaxID=297713 RepID=A0AAW0BIR2_9AGAR
MDMPLDILYEIFGNLEPFDVLRLAWTSTKLRRILMSRSAVCVWKSACMNVGLPEIIPSMNEPAFINFIFHPRCHFCTSIVHSVEWYALVRCCKACMAEKFVPLEELIALGVEIPNYSQYITPFVDIAHSKSKVRPEWRSFDRLFLLSAAKKLFGEYSTVPEKERLQWCRRKLELKSSDDEQAEKCKKWTEDQTGDREARRAMVKKERANEILDKLRAMGWDQELGSKVVLGNLLDHKLVDQSKPLTDRIWKAIEPKLGEFMVSLREKRLTEEKLAMSARRYQVVPTVIQTIEISLPLDLVMPSALDVALLEPFKTVIEDLPIEAGADMSLFEEAAKMLPVFIQQWNMRRKQDVFDAFLKKKPDATEYDLYLCTTLFQCNRPHCALANSVYPYLSVLGHHCEVHVSAYTGPDLPPWCNSWKEQLPVSAPQGEIEVGVHEGAVDVIRKLGTLEKMKLPEARLSAVMDMNPFVECRTCEMPCGSRLFFRWSQAVQHNSAHDFAPVSEKEALIVATKEHITVFDKFDKERFWVCGRCRFRDCLRDVRSHVEIRHGIAKNKMSEDDFEFFPLAWDRRKRAPTDRRMAKKRKIQQGEEEKENHGQEVVKKNARRGRSLHSMLKLPLDVLFEILGHLKPYDLLRLSWTTKQLRQTLMSRSSTSVWKTSLSNIGIPDSFSRFSTPVFAAMRGMEFKFPQSLWVTLPYILDEPNPYSGARTSLYSLQCAQELSTEFSAVDLKEHEKFMERKLQESKQKDEIISALSIWDQSRANDREAELNEARESRLAAIVSKLNNAGWSAELADEGSLAELSQHKLVKQPKPLTERIWKNIGPTLIDFMSETRDIRIAKERLNTSRERYRLVAGILRTVEMSLPRNMVMPLEIDVAFWEPFKNIIEDLPIEAGADISIFEEAIAKLPQFIEDWNLQRKKASLRALKQHKTSATEEDLYASTALFRCQNPRCGSRIYNYPGILSHHCSPSDDAAPPQWCSGYTNPNTSAFWNQPAAADPSFEYVCVAADHSREVSKLYFLDCENTSSRTMAEINPIVECKTCSKQPGKGRHFFRWTHVLGHEHLEFAAVSKEDLVVVMEQESASSSKMSRFLSFLHARKERERIHRCKYCNFRDGLASVRDHLTTCHDIEETLDDHWEYTYLVPLHEDSGRGGGADILDQMNFSSWQEHAGTQESIVEYFWLVGLGVNAL